MFKRLKFSFVAAIILALIGPTSPASVASLDAGFSAAADASISIQLTRNGDAVEGYINIEGIGESQLSYQESTGSPESLLITFAALAPGDYIAYAQDWSASGLGAEGRFELTIDANGSVTAFHALGDASQAVAKNGDVYNIPIFDSHFYFPVLLPDGTEFNPVYADDGSGPRLDAHLQKQNVSGNWEIVETDYPRMYESYSGDTVTEVGIKGRVPATGKYRVEVFPYGIAAAAKAVSPSFTIDDLAETLRKLDPVRLVKPALLVSVVAPGSVSPIPMSSVRVFTEQSSEDFYDHNATLPIAVTFPAVGTYQIQVSTDSSSHQTLAAKSYTVVVSDVAGVLVGEVQGQTAVDGVYNLELASANLLVRAVNPDGVQLDSSSLTIFELRGTADRGEYVTNTWSQNASIMALTLSDGSYILELQPHEDNYLISSELYFVTVSSAGQNVLVETFGANSTPILPGEDGVHTLKAALANVIGQVVDAEGNYVGTDWNNRRWVSVNLQKSNGDYFEWAGNANVDSLGRFAFKVPEAGTYQLELRPEGFPNVANLTLPFTLVTDDLAGVTVVSNFVLMPDGTEVIKLPAPDVKLSVTVPGGGEALKHVHIEVLQNGSYLFNSNTGEAGIAAISFPGLGTFEIRVNPPRSAPGTAKANYTAVVTDSGSGRAVAIAGSTASGSALLLELGVPSLSGIVTDPSGTNLMSETEVVAVDRATGWELWEYSARTDSFGRWSMALPEGTYDIYARTPWGNSDYGDGDRIGPVSVSASGVATVPDGYSALAFDLSLNSPTWSGTLVSPLDPSELLTNGNVCLAAGSQDLRTWTCSQTDANGRWAIAKPAGFTSFGVDDELSITQWGSTAFAQRRLRGATEIQAVLGTYVAGQTYEGIELSPAAPNLEITVRAGDGPAANVWVGVDNGFEWLGGGETNSQGIAKIAIPDSALGDELNLQVNIEHNGLLSENYASVRKVDPAVENVGPLREVTVALALPNFRVSVSEPSEPFKTVSYGWIEIINEDTGEWIGGSNTNSSGASAINLPADGIYVVTVNPAWNAAAEFGKASYRVTVASGAVTTVVPLVGVTPVDLVAGVYALQLGVPSLRGVVLDSANQAVRDAWVTPIAQNGWEYMWWLGSNTRSGGSFAIGLPTDSIYELEANPPWSNPLGDTRSLRCGVEILNGVLNTGYDGVNKCAIADGGVVLKLRKPNLTFTLTDGVKAVPHANVGMFLGGWNIWAQSNRLGEVSINLDHAEILAHAGVASGTHDIRIVVEPPYGSSDLARWECNSGDLLPLCQSITDFSTSDSASAWPVANSGTLDLGPLAFAPPNTKIRVGFVGAGGVVAPLLERGSWVVIYKEVGQGKQWLSSATSDALGFVAFNLDLTNSADTYTVEVNPPHSSRQVYAQSSFAGLTRAQLLSKGIFELASPNFKVKMLDPTGAKAASWGWVGVEQVADATGASPQWLSGTGTDKSGSVALNLQSSKFFKITLNPGHGSAGVRTSCLVQTDSAGAATRVAGKCTGFVKDSSGVWEIKLSAGNVTGKASFVLSGTTKFMAGVLVQATATGFETQTTTTKADGSYALNLEEEVDWTITAYYVPKAGEAFASNKVSLAAFKPEDDPATPKDLVFNLPD